MRSIRFWRGKMDKKRVLVVDDDADIAKMLKIRIEAEGYEFMSAMDGKEMLEALNIKKPDVILLDIMLPGMDGYSVLREMRKNERYFDIPVIILSAKEKKKVGDLFMLEKAVFFIEKPFDIKDLLEKIRIAMGGKSNG
jgi:DNA-binding response OmpR family regulator